jgi:hypothetical protein
MTTPTQFIYNQNNNKAFAVIPSAEFEKAFGQPQPDLDAQIWLEADMGEDLPKWSGDLPLGQPLTYQTGVGFVVGGKNGG